MSNVQTENIKHDRRALPTLFLLKLYEDIRYNELTVAPVDKIYDVTFRIKTLQQYSFSWSFFKFWPELDINGVLKQYIQVALLLSINNSLNPCANRQTIVGCLMLHVTSVCTPCCMLLGVVAQSLKPVKLLLLQGHNIVGSCCVCLHIA